MITFLIRKGEAVSTKNKQNPKELHNPLVFSAPYWGFCTDNNRMTNYKFMKDIQRQDTTIFSKWQRNSKNSKDVCFEIILSRSSLFTYDVLQPRDKDPVTKVKPRKPS